MGFFGKMISRLNARNRFRNAGNMNRRLMPNMFGRMGGGIGSIFPRFRPPTIEEAKGRNMANVGLLPDYMQPGGSGIPPMEVGAPVDPVAEPANRSAIMPRGPVMNRPRPPIGMAPFQQGRMAMGFKAGGPAKYPNAGLAALAKEAPEVVERMGYQEGGALIKDLPTLVRAIESSQGPLTKKEYDLVREAYQARLTPQDTLKVLQDYKRGRIPETRMLKELERMQPKKFDIRKGIRSLARAPKFTLPSAALGFGAGFLLDNFLDEEPEMVTTTYTQEEIDEMRRRAND